ncbi:hypothetical protein NBRC116495_27660 [Aurantivibrio plasticivorans]
MVSPTALVLKNLFRTCDFNVTVRVATESAKSKSMKSPLFDVIYIDKFRDPSEVSRFNRQAKQRFNLSDGALHILGAGDPILIKKRQGQKQAESYRQVIESIGGVCWYQPAADDGKYHDRRHVQRRGLLDRRTCYRASSVLSDRRCNRGRRSSDRS